jgi:Glyoxalase-like domain
VKIGALAATRIYMTTSIQIVFDTADPAREAEFWAAALGYALQPPPAGYDSWEAFLRARGVPADRWNDASAITDPDGKGPRIYFQRVPEGKTAKNRMHLDLKVSGGPGTDVQERHRRVDAEVARIKALGASDERGPFERDGEYWVRMNDPEGNEFCVQ